MRIQALEALRQIGWPGGRLRQTGFSTAFATERETAFQANPLQKVITDGSNAPGVLIIERTNGLW
jgi:hypothetical protein